MINAGRNNRVLGIAVGERSMLVAEVVCSAAPSLVKAAEFQFPEGSSLKEPAALGESLGAFLKEQGFTTRTAVFGLPAKWVLSRKKEVPAADASIVAETLRLQAEGEFSAEVNDLVYDYSGEPSMSEGRSVLLMAVPRRYVDQISKIAVAARLRAAAVTASGTALAAAIGRKMTQTTALLIEPWGIEYTAQNGGNPRVLRHLGVAAATAPLLTSELRRAMAASLNGAAVSTNGHARGDLLVWNDSGIDQNALPGIGDSVGVSVRSARLADLGVNGDGAAAGRDFASPVSLALAAAPGARPAADFLHSRLAPPVQRTIDRRMVLLVAAAIAIVLGGGYWIYSLYSRQNSVTEINNRLTAMKQDIDTAQASVNRVEFARHWHAEHPKFLGCLRDLTLAAPEGGQFYATSLNLRDEGKTNNEPLKGSFSGKVAREEVLKPLVDHMKASGEFADITTRTDARSSTNAGREVSFIIGFNYVPKENVPKEK